MENLNKNISEGKWRQLKGEVQKRWGKITDQDLEQVKGNLGKLAGIVQERYGESQAKVRQSLNEIFEREDQRASSDQDFATYGEAPPTSDLSDKDDRIATT